MVHTEVAVQPCDASWLDQYSRDFRRVKPMYGTANPIPRILRTISLPSLLSKHSGAGQSI